jgi:hypothetical protein
MTLREPGRGAKPYFYLWAPQSAHSAFSAPRPLILQTLEAVAGDESGFPD